MIDRLIASQGEDRILLLSGGPKSHLATRSMFAKGMKKRLVITQPNIDSQKTHSPLSGETIISKNKKISMGIHVAEPNVSKIKIAQKKKYKFIANKL